MRRVTIFLSFILLQLVVYAQINMDETLKHIEENHPVLAAFKKQLEARQMGALTDIFLNNPELEFHYLWGDPASMGTRVDFSISQSFDFPTAYFIRQDIAEMKLEQLQLEYEREKTEVFYRAKVLLIEIIYANRTIKNLEERVAQARKLAEALDLKLKIGDVGQLDHRKAQLNLMQLEQKLKQQQIQRKSKFERLEVISGGILTTYDQNTFSRTSITANFDEWLNSKSINNPLLNWLKSEIVLKEKEKSLTKALKLPSVKAGYMSETVVGESFRGVAVGVSIPLWENKNKSAYARLSVLAAEQDKESQELMFYSKLKDLHHQAFNLNESIGDYGKKMKVYHLGEILETMYQTGEISLLDYLLEMTFMYENEDQLLELEREYNLVLAEIDRML